MESYKGLFTRKDLVLLTPHRIFTRYAQGKVACVFIKMHRSEFENLTLEGELELSQALKTSAEFLEHALLMFEFDSEFVAREFIKGLGRFKDLLELELYVDGKERRF